MGLSQISGIKLPWFTHSTDIGESDYMLRANGVCDMKRIMPANFQKSVRALSPSKGEPLVNGLEQEFGRMYGLYKLWAVHVYY